MNCKRTILLLIALVVALAGLCPVRAATVVLQEGVNGYSGTQDSYYIGGLKDDHVINYGECPQAIVGGMQFNGG